MSLPRRRALIRFGAGVAVAVTAIFTVGSGPAFAEDTLGAKADLSVHVPGPQVAVGADEKTIRVDVTNHGPGDVKHGKVSFSTADVPDSVTVDLPTGPGCEKQVTKLVCDLDELRAGGHDSSLAVFLKQNKPDLDAGPVGTLTVSVSSELTDPDASNNTETVQLELIDPAVNLTTFGTDITLDPGASALLPFTILNQGSLGSANTDVSIKLPDFVTFTGDLTGCDVSGHNSAVVCHYPGLAAGGHLVNEGLDVKLAADAPGPVALTGGSIGATGQSVNNPPPLAVQAHATRPTKTFSTNKPVPPLTSKDASPGDGMFNFTVFTTANPADLAVTATAASGHVGDVVSVTVTVKNNGPATATDAAVTITAPSGTTIVDGLGCTPVTAGKVVKCTGKLANGESDSGTFKFKIDSATVGSDGEASITSSLKDPDLTNNKAAIKITVLSNGLPVTGTQVGLIGGSGVAAIAVGWVLFLAARRRRVLLVTPDDERTS
jgi:uncharacterized repeat protein (TIGR01451 family)